MNACRSALLVDLDPTSEEKESVMVHCKHNLSPTGPGPSIAYKTLPGHVFQWTRLSRLGAADVLLDRDRSGSALGEAEAWLQELLAAGPMPVSEILEAGRAGGISERTLRRARERICQRPSRIGDHWVWQLHGQGGQP